MLDDVEVKPLQQWQKEASSLLSPEILERARSLANELMSPYVDLMRGDVRTALAYGLLTPSEAMIDAVGARMSMAFTRYLLLELGQALSMKQHHIMACRVFAALGHNFAHDPSNVRVKAVSACADDLRHDARSGRFEREIYTWWGSAVQHGRPTVSAAVEDVYRLALRRGVWGSALQRPLEHYVPSLRRRPFWEAKDLPAAMALEAAFPEILGELNALLAHRERTFARYHSRVVTSGGWSDVQLYAGCRADRAHCKLCPRTAELIAAQPSINSVIFGSHFFSRLVPGTHLSTHCGPSNFRLRCHLGLVVPPGARIRVGEEVREWRAGECLIFDDSYEHEVWHEGSDDRVVLICDMWHPDVRLDRHIAPLLNPTQKEAMASAQMGRHLAVQERTYSTGMTVTRTGGD